MSIDALQSKIRKHKAPIIVGLDPIPELLPPELRSACGEGRRLWVALPEQEPVGWVSLRDGSLSDLYLCPEFRYRRMGDQLYGQAVSQLRVAGVKTVHIGVPTLNVRLLPPKTPRILRLQPSAFF